MTLFLWNLTALFCLISLSGYVYQYQRQRLVLTRWRKSLNLERHASIFNQIFNGTNGFILSQEARRDNNAFDYLYGEIEFEPFIALLSLVQPNQNTIFYDLGSGIGKAVLACAMVYPVRKSIGIELFPALQSCACERIKELAAVPHYQETAARIHFILGDFLKENMEDATLIFINSTAFIGPTWDKICAILDQLPSIEHVITTSKPLRSAHFIQMKRTKIEMSWGVVFAFIHIRKTYLEELH